MRISDWSSDVCSSDLRKVEQFTFNNVVGAMAAKATLQKAANGELTVGTVDKKQRRRNPAPPFTTSTLQQEANRKLGFAASRTMRAAQHLYEGLDLGGATVGLLPSMRTDSVHLVRAALPHIRQGTGRSSGGE